MIEFDQPQTVREVRGNALYSAAWKAANSYEFLTTDQSTFKGDTQFFLGTEVKETGSQLIQISTKDLIQLILPISLEVAVIFYDKL